MVLPFTVEQFLDVFERYNLAIWPLQLFFYVLGLIVIAFAFRPWRSAGRVISSILGLMWLWMGIVYHLLFFREINPLATMFGVLFIVQGAIWLALGVMRTRLTFGPRRDLPSIVGALCIVYA